MAYYRDRLRPFRAAEACQVLNSPDLTRVIRTAPRGVRGGEVYVYCIEDGTDPDGWKDDNIHFQHDGTSRQPKNKPTIKKTFFQAKFSETEFSREFRKHVYVLYPRPNQFVLIHYLGNVSIAKEPRWPRRASKSTPSREGHTSSSGCDPCSGTSQSVNDTGQCDSSTYMAVSEDDECPVPPKRQKLQIKRAELKRKVEAILADIDNPALWEVDTDLRSRGTQSSRSVTDQLEDLVTSGQFASIVDGLLCDVSWQMRRGVSSRTNPCMSLTEQVRLLWPTDLSEVQARLQDMDVVNLLQFDELEQETLMVLLSAVVVGAYRTDTPTLSFMPTLQQWPRHLGQAEIEDVEVDVTASYRIGDMTIDGSSLATLQGRTWLDDNVIECYLRLLCDGCLLRHHCYVLPCQLAMLWEREQYSQYIYKDVDLRVFTWLLMPVCVGNSHWVLLVANVRDKTICVINSRQSDETLKLIPHWRQYMAVRSTLTGQTLRTWRERPYKTLPQTDGDSCGVHVLMAAETLLKGQPPCVMRNCHTKRFRRYALNRLLSNGHMEQQPITTGRTDSPQVVCVVPPQIKDSECTSNTQSCQAASTALTPLLATCRHLYSNNKVLFAALLLLAMQGGEMKAIFWNFPKRRHYDEYEDEDEDEDENERRWNQWDWALQLSGVEDPSKAYSYNDISQCRDILQCKVFMFCLYVECKPELFQTLNVILCEQTEYIIKTLPLQFICDHVFVQQPDSVNILHVLIRPCHYQLLARRFAAAVVDRRYAHVFRHPACNDPKFVQHLAAGVKDLTPDERHLLYSSTDIGRSFLSCLCSPRERFLYDSFCVQGFSLQDCTMEEKVRVALLCCQSGNIEEDGEALLWMLLEAVIPKQVSTKGHR